jgi:prevent-host-death family protein
MFAVMKYIGIFEAKTKLSELCETVAKTGESVTVTKRGKPLVQIRPVEPQGQDIVERRNAYLKRYGRTEKKDKKDFEVPARSREVIDFNLD